MSSRTLPDRPNLDQLKRQAHELHRSHGARDLSAADRIAAHHPAMQHLAPGDVATRPVSLTDAQLVIAREYGFTTWADLKHHVENTATLAGLAPHPRFAEALATFDAGDLEGLRRLLQTDPSLVHARANLDPPYGYFSGATLLHHTAGNPDRGVRLPGTVVDLARLLLDEGADVHARTLGPNGGTVMGLLITSRRASDEGVTGPLMDLLLERGAHLDVDREGALDDALANGAPRAAEKMIALGARPDVIAAAALGRMDLLQAAFDRHGRITSRPHRGGRELPAREAIGLAMLCAYVRDQREAVQFLLEKDGDWNVTGVGNGTALHRAAWNGDLDMVRRLVALGADVSARDAAYGGTPLSWADHNGQRHVAEWMAAHCPIDLHDAVSFGLRAHAEARLRDDPASVNARRRQGSLPLATPLHCAASTQREDMAALLLQHGADPAALAGNGLTALDIADASGATALIGLLEAHGAPRSSEAERPSGDPRLRPFEKQADDVLEAYRSGNEGAIQRLQEFFNSRLTAWDIRRAVRMRLQKGRTSGAGSDPSITPGQARDVVAGVRGFGSWAGLVRSVTRHGTSWAAPAYSIDRAEARLEVRRPLGEEEWDAIIPVIAAQGIRAIDAGGQMTDAALARLGELDHVTDLQLSGSKRVSDAGLRELPRFTNLRRLNLSGCSFTDDGLAVLRQLAGLRTFELHWHTAVSDAGIAHLAACERLERVDVMGSPLGDGLISALAGKRHLQHLKTGSRVTDAALPLLHELPMYRNPHDGEIRLSLMAAEADPNHLMLDGPFTDTGLQALRGLDGLAGLSFFWHSKAFTSAGLTALTGLPNLVFLGCEGSRCDDDAMRHIAAIPGLRMLQAQGTVATDTGFAALSRSPTLEYLWGRECANLTSDGFRALARLPSLRGLAVGCSRVDDGALSLLPGFPALRELVPMDVQDPGFRHVGHCVRLERLWCMYCRDTTDAATGAIAALPALLTYYAGQTRITDRSLEMLSGMTSLEELEFWNCAGITDAGVAALARLPKLRTVSFDGCRHVSAEVTRFFPEHVRARRTA